MTIPSGKEISLNDLPLYSLWPARLLGLEPWGQREKTPSEINREYNIEKWGGLLNRADNAHQDISVEKVDSWYLEEASPCLVCCNDKIILTTPHKALIAYKEFLCKTISSFMPASSLVDLGAGYGSVIFYLMSQHAFSKIPIMAAEYTSSGRELLKRIASDQNVSLSIGSCDLGSDYLVDFDIPPGAVIFTSFAAHYIPQLSHHFVQKLKSFKPSAIINVEPCYEHCDQDTLIGLLRAKYIRLNDYNTNLYSILAEQHKDGHINLLRISRAVFGLNPFLTASVLIWN